MPERITVDMCPMCQRERTIVFDVTVARGGGEFDVLSVCDECAPRAANLLRWLGRAPQ